LNHTFEPLFDFNLSGTAGTSAFYQSKEVGCCFGINIFGGQLPNLSPY